MRTVRENIGDLVTEAIHIHTRERELTLRSMEVCGQLYRWRAHVQVGLTMDEFAVRIGLTPDVYAKRAKASAMTKRFPRIKRMIEAGELAVSSVAALYSKLTEANESALLDAVANKPKHEVERLARRIRPDGQWTLGPAEIDLRLTVSESDMKKIDRAREVLAHGGKVPATVEVLMQAIEDLLERRDPMRRAARSVVRPGAKAKNQNKKGPGDAVGVAADACSHPNSIRPGAPRPAIPAAIKHHVTLRDDGQCTWVNPDGRRCPERMMLEFDHIVAWRHGGRHSVDNLTLRCRCHNQHRAEMELGRPLRACRPNAPGRELHPG